VAKPAALLVAIAAALATASVAQAGQSLLVGTADDAAQQPDLLSAKTELTLARATGLRAVRLSIIWTPNQTEPWPDDLARLENAVAAADLTGTRLLFQVRPWGGKTAPRTNRDRAQFAAYAAGLARRFPSVRDFVIGNEPNLNRFWMPQFTRDGRSAAPGAYLALLAASYDALKQVDPGIRVVGGALAARGSDNPKATRHTHSPTRFIQQLGRAYRRSARKTPVMDAFAHHPYGDHSSQVPEFQHHPRSTTIGLGDYHKLATLIGRAFDGTAQPGWTLPIYYDEYGIDSRIPVPHRSLYRGEELPVTRPVSERLQGHYYARALALAACQPRVEMLLIFHVSDEPNLTGWQSGVYYVDDRPKASQPILRQAITAVEEDALASCSRPGRPRRLFERAGFISPA
jgi:hypothetical protein